MSNLRDKLAGGTVVLSDGAWGTQLQGKGLSGCPELWNLEHPEAVAAVAGIAAAKLKNTRKIYKYSLNLDIRLSLISDHQHSWGYEQAPRRCQSLACGR